MRVTWLARVGVRGSCVVRVVCMRGVRDECSERLSSSELSGVDERRGVERTNGGCGLRFIYYPPRLEGSFLGCARLPANRANRFQYYRPRFSNSSFVFVLSPPSSLVSYV